jgi:hypothetical protein
MKKWPYKRGSLPLQGQFTDMEIWLKQREKTCKKREKYMRKRKEAIAVGKVTN